MMNLKILAVESDRQIMVLRLLFSRFPVDVQAQKLNDALQSIERGSLNLKGLLVAEENGLPVGATLYLTQRDRVALVWPPVVTCQASDATAVEHALLDRLVEALDQSGSKLSQVLLAPGETAEADALQQHRFESAGEIFFLARQLTSEDGTRDLVGEFELMFETFHESNADRFAAVIERTYEGSLDCPFLHGFRSGAEAILSHQSTGVFDPAGWRLYHRGKHDVGVLLMNEHPDNDAIELVYWGIQPEFRGLGMGRRILKHGLQAAALTGRSILFLTVDSGNVYANSLYGEFGFAELARRKILIRRSS